MQILHIVPLGTKMPLKIAMALTNIQKYLLYSSKICFNNIPVPKQHIHVNKL